ncbi:MAG: hypothetical protein ACOX4F_01600 [Atopobiaceae bacterium]
MGPESKPLPFVIDGKPYYTLSSYEPLSFEVFVPQVTEEDVSLALEEMVRAIGGSPENLNDIQWLQAHFQGAHDLEQLRGVIRSQLNVDNNLEVRNAIISKTLDALSTRLSQEPLPQEVEAARTKVKNMALTHLQERGATMSEDMEKGIDTLVDQQAVQVATQEAALLAYAVKHEMSVEPDELPNLLEMDEDTYQELVENASPGELDELTTQALRSKALNTIVREAHISWHYESDREAHERIAQLRHVRDLSQYGTDDPARADGSAPNDAPDAPEPDNSHFKLV